MTTSVVTVDRVTPYKEIAVLMAEHKISAVPVLVLGRHVGGVVSEADLLSVLDKRAREAQLESGGLLHRQAGDKKHWGLTAGELMTSPAITIHPDATLPGAARLMNSRHLKRLPVVEAGTPSIPAPGLPYSDTRPKPEEVVASAYDFAEQLLTSQRKFAENVIEATKPLLGANEGPAAKEGDTG